MVPLFHEGDTFTVECCQFLESDERSMVKYIRIIFYNFTRETTAVW